MIGGVEKPMAGKLALDFNQCLTYFSKRTRADRLVIDEGSATAIAGQCPPQDQSFSGFGRIDIVFLEAR